MNFYGVVVFERQQIPKISGNDLAGDGFLVRSVTSQNCGVIIFGKNSVGAEAQ
jgi:hypothetical protein